MCWRGSSCFGGGDMGLMELSERRRDDHQEMDASLPVRSHVEQLLEWWRAYIGDGTVGVSWYRTGSQSITILGRGSKWTARDIYGSLGNVRCTIDRSNMQIDTVSLDYSVDGGVLNLKAATRLPMSILELDATMKSAQSFGVSPMLILSAVSLIWALFNPRLDVLLPGEMDCTMQLKAGVLSVVFTNPPSVRLQALTDTQWAVKQVTVTPLRAAMELTGTGILGRWTSRTQTFDIV